MENIPDETGDQPGADQPDTMTTEPEGSPAATTTNHSRPHSSASWASSEAVRHSMQGNRSRDTRPELAVRRLLFAHGLRFRVIYRPVKTSRATADIAFVRARTLVLIDGCFWHGCPDHYTAPATNPSYWQLKVARNQERDQRTTALFTDQGWTVLRYWEHERPADIAADVAAHVRPFYPATVRHSKTASSQPEQTEQ